MHMMATYRCSTASDAANSKRGATTKFQPVADATVSPLVLVLTPTKRPGEHLLWWLHPDTIVLSTSRPWSIVRKLSFNPVFYCGRDRIERIANRNTLLVSLRAAMR